MPMDLYHFSASAPCQAVRLVAATLGVDLNLKEINLITGEQLKPEFLKMNPQHTVPTLDDNGFYLWESRAICTYLIEKYAKNDSLYPKDPKQRAVINQRLQFDLGTLYISFAQYHIIERAPADPAKLQKCHEVLDLLDNFLEGNKYVAGDHLTVADLVLVTTANCYITLNFDMSKHQNTEKWIKRIAAEAPKYNEIVGEGAKLLKAWADSKLKN